MRPISISSKHSARADGERPEAELDRPISNAAIDDYVKSPEGLRAAEAMMILKAWSRRDARASAKFSFFERYSARPPASQLR